MAKNGDEEVIMAFFTKELGEAVKVKNCSTCKNRVFDIIGQASHSTVVHTRESKGHLHCLLCVPERRTFTASTALMDHLKASHGAAN